MSNIHTSHYNIKNTWRVKENMENSENKKVTISAHSTFENFVSEGLRIGSHIVAAKSHGKTRLMFSIAEQLQKQENVRCQIFDGSETWIYSASRIAVFNVGERDILATNRKSIDTIEKYSLENWNLVKLALDSYPSILWRLKTRSPSKRGFFIRTIANYLDLLQREEKANSPTHENTKAIAYFIEEAQNAFSSRNSASSENETFLTVFNEGRNNKEGFFTNSQRLTDFSKTIRSKQIQCIGKLSNEDITPSLRRLEKLHGLEFANMKPRMWFYEGETFVSPTFTQHGKPFIVNEEIKKKWMDSLPMKESLAQKIARWFKPKVQQKVDQPQQQPQTQNSENLDQSVYDDNPQATQEEDLESDCALLEDDELGF
jgi:uncharacterized protein (DUF2141 family)